MSSLLKRCAVVASLFLASCVGSAAPAVAASDTASIEANLNMSRCLVYKEGFGETFIQNICSGENTVIAWTFGDWAWFLSLSGLAILFIGCLFVTNHFRN